MAISFRCPSCSQPIEVDDEWALHPVGCPYCGNTVAAPTESTLDVPATVPTASPLGAGPEEPGGRFSQGPVAVSGDASPNRIATVALGLVLASVALLVAARVILAPHRDVLEKFMEASDQAKSYAEAMERQAELIQEMGGLPGWMVAAFACVMLAGLSWLASIPCGMIGVRNTRNRKQAIVALIIAGMVPLFLCCGGIAAPTQ